MKVYLGNQPIKQIRMSVANTIKGVDTSSDTVNPETLLYGYTAHDSSGNPIQGRMMNNGDVSTNIDGLTTTSVTIPAGYTTGGTIGLTSDIENALAEI